MSELSYIFVIENKNNSIMIRAGPFLIWTYYDMITNGVYSKSEYTPSHPYIKKGLDMYLLTQFKRWERWGLLYLICIIVWQWKMEKLIIK